MPKSICLHDYQIDIKLRLANEWQTHRSVMVQMPTGTGKTHVLAAVVDEELRNKNEETGRGNAVFIIAHRRELVAQIEETVGRFGIGRTGDAVRVMSIQWLSRHWEEVEGTPELVIIDEAHHAVAETYKEMWSRWPRAKFLGLTATPCRMNRRGFTDLFESLVCSWNIAEFIGKGRLSAFDYISIRSDSREQRLIDSLKKRGTDGDYQIREMDETLNKRPNIERLYESVRKFADNKKGIVYAISIDHARSIAAYYSRMGMSAVAIDSKTPMGERKRLVSEFKTGKVKVMVNVDVFSEGFDCPAVEFVQMARPTLSLAKYLQQVGRGLRKTKGKQTCVLIDNVGLYRVFGLPTVAWDWEAMFRGEAAGKGPTRCIGQPNNLSSSLETRSQTADSELEMIVSHDHLLADIAARDSAPAALPTQQPALTAWQDQATGLWGLSRGRKKTTLPLFDAILDTRQEMAAVRFGENSCGLVNAEGQTLWQEGHCLSMQFTRNDFLTVRTPDGKFHYVDLHGLRMYDERPEVKCFGGVELLKIGDIYYSRTQKLYVNNQHLNSNCIYDRKFYIAIFDYKVPSFCCMQDSRTEGECRWGYVCLLNGDHESFYYIYRWLADGSIIVTDDSGRFYHAADGKKKEYVGCQDSTEDEACCQAEIGRIAQQAQKVAHQPDLKETGKKLQLLHNPKEAVPFRSGMKWGLKVGERITVPPVYRNVKPPVGRYCAVEKSYSQWGVIAVDGTILVEPQYPEIAIQENGTAILTFVTGKKISVKL